MKNTPTSGQPDRTAAAAAEINANREATRTLEAQTEGQPIPPPQQINFHD